MADGAHRMTAAVSEGRTHRLAWLGEALNWLFRRRGGRLLLWTLTAAALLASVLFAHVFGPLHGVLDTLESKIAFLGAAALCVFPFVCLFLDADDNLHRGPALRLPIISLVLLGALTTLAIVDAELRDHSTFGAPNEPLTLAMALARVVFFVFLGIFFVPNIWNAANFAKHEASKQASKPSGVAIATDEDEDAMGALVGTIAVLLIGVLAAVAGGVGNTVAFESFYGLVLCGVVIGVFAVVILLDWLASTPFVRGLTRGMQSLARRVRFLSKFYNWVDTGLVRIGASVAGMGHAAAWRRYALLASTLTCLSLLAWYLPAPLGLVPVVLGLIVAISVSRLWAWVEDDRALAAMTEYNPRAPYRAGFREDFRDETLLGFVFVFVLLPIAMMQAHEGQIFGPELFDNAESKSFLEWFGFFGVELAKAVPIVDWAEIYGVRAGEDLIGFTTPPSRHAVFLARIMVDLVLIAALLQAIGVTTRSRNLKRLYAGRHIKRLDELLERKELDRAIRTASLTQSSFGAESEAPSKARELFDLTRLSNDGLVDFRHYDEERLRFLYWSGNSPALRAFVAALSVEGRGFPLANAMDQTIEIADTHKNEVALATAFERALADHEAGTRLIDVNDIYLAMSPLRSQTGLRDFKELLVDTMAHVGQADEVVDTLTGLAGGANADAFQYTRKKISAVVARLVPQMQNEELIKETYNKWKHWSKHQRPNCAEYGWVISALEARLAPGKRL